MKENKKYKTTDFIKNFMNGLYTKEEAQKVLDLIKNDDEFDTVDHSMQDAWMESEDDTPITAYEQEQNQKEALIFLSQIKKQDKRSFNRRVIRRSLAIAASIAALVILFVGGYKYLPSASIQQMTYTEEATSFGERKTVILPDGTTVNLNACSKIKYPTTFMDDKRTVHLEGEAFFKVVKNSKQPFVVGTYKFDVTVLGTEFDVRAYQEDETLSVSVVSGKVQIDMPESMTRLVAYEHLVINSTTNEFQKIVDQGSVGIWRTGSLRFNKTPIKEVVKELERIYNYTFIFDPNSDFDNQITGEHNNKSLDAVLKSIEQTSGIKAKQTGRTITLYKQ